jgi:glycosyltransferase involved in cell wall biosynthesis
MMKAAVSKVRLPRIWFHHPQERFSRLSGWTARMIFLLDLSRRFGGAETRVRQIANALKNEVDLQIAVLAGSETESRLRECRVPLHAFSRHPKDPRLVLDLAKAFQMTAPDVVDAHNPQSQLWGIPAARLAHVGRRIMTVHSRYAVTESSGRFYEPLLGRLQNMATETVAVCETVAETLKRGSRSPIVIHNGIEMSVALPRVKAADRPWTVGIVGRLVPIKAHAVALEALATVRRALPPHIFLIVGEGPEHAQLARLVSDLKLESSVEFLGARTDVQNLLAKMDLLCIPSLMEGLPFVALEASAARTPILASAVGGLARHFSHGETAILVEPGNADALARELLWCSMHEDQLAMQAERAYRLVELQFSVANMIEHTRSVYGLTGAKPSQNRD